MILLQLCQEHTTTKPEYHIFFGSVSIGFKQSLNGYNRFRWESHSPVQFERAKLAFIQDLEDIAYNATNYFFNVATAEINVRIAEINYANADTLYRIGKGVLRLVPSLRMNYWILN